MTRGTAFDVIYIKRVMDEKKNTPQPDKTQGEEIERTHEMYQKGGPAPGTRDAGKEGEAVAHTQAENGELGQSNAQATDPGKLNRSED